jgi:hypothetical protein
MRGHRRLLNEILAVGAVALAMCPPMKLVAEPARAQQIWFSPGDDLEVAGVVAHPDFPRLFEDPSVWPTGLAHIDVMQFRPAYVTRLPAQAAKDYAYLKARHIAIAVNMSVMPSDTCGQGVEGIMSPKGVDFYPRMIKAAGVDLDAVLMDEPLYFGHDYAGKNACKLSVAEVAQGVARSVATIRSYHPHAKFILAEPQLALPGGPKELAQFLDAYKAAVGEYPASVRLDIQWRKNWRTDLPPFLAMLEARHIGFGVIYNAPGGIGTCLSGQIKEIIGGSNRKYRTSIPRPGTERSTNCIPR